MNKFLFAALALAMSAHAVSPVTVTADPQTAVYKGPKTIALFKSANGIGSATFPSQTGHAGEFLSTDGTNPLWITPPGGVPTMVGQTGKILTNNGTDANWATINSLLGANLVALDGLTGAANKFPYFTGLGTMALGDMANLAHLAGNESYTGSKLFTLNGAGNFVVDGSGGGEIVTSGENFQFTGPIASFLGNDSSFVPLTVRATSGQIAHIQDWKVGNVVMAYVAANGDIIGSNLTNASNLTSGTLADARLSSNVVLRDVDSSFGPGTNIGFVNLYATGFGQFEEGIFGGNNAASLPLRIVSNAAQSADLFQILDSTGTGVEINVSPAFNLNLHGHSLQNVAGLSGTNTGDQTSIVGITGTLSEFNAALTGADFASGGGTVTGASSGTNTGDQTIALSGDVSGSGTAGITTTIGASKITSAMIVDGAIVNADINASAAIAASKIAGLATSATTDTTNASNIASGTIATARLSSDMQVKSMGGSIGSVSGTATVLVSGTKGYWVAPCNGTITGWKAVCAPSGSVAFDIFKSAYSTTTLPTTSIVAAAAPSITTAVANKSTTLTGWTTSFAADDLFAFVITGTPSSATWSTIQLTYVPN